jgi:hypothetical protein
MKLKMRANEREREREREECSVCLRVERLKGVVL